VVDERNTALINSVDWLIAEIKDGSSSQEDVLKLMTITEKVKLSFLVRNFIVILLDSVYIY
jgi:hypothetical protein